MTPETLTSRLHAQADAALRKRLSTLLDGAFKDLTGTFPTHCTPTLWEHVAHELPPAGYDKKFWVPRFFEELKEMTFKALMVANRNQAVSSFVAKVESLDSQLEGIRQEVR
jgi:hypothetical protein